MTTQIVLRLMNSWEEERCHKTGMQCCRGLERLDQVRVWRAGREGVQRTFPEEGSVGAAIKGEQKLPKLREGGKQGVSSGGA